MSKANLDELQTSYKQAADQWVFAIRAEEALANADHSETEMEHWDAADFHVQDAQKQAKEVRDAYKEGLRQLHYGFWFPRGTVATSRRNRSSKLEL